MYFPWEFVLLKIITARRCHFDPLCHQWGNIQQLPWGILVYKSERHQLKNYNYTVQTDKLWRIHDKVIKGLIPCISVWEWQEPPSAAGLWQWTKEGHLERVSNSFQYWNHRRVLRSHWGKRGPCEPAKSDGVDRKAVSTYCKSPRIISGGVVDSWSINQHG